MSEADGARRARILAEALPFIRRYHRQVVAVKLGGSVLTDQQLLDALARDVSLLTMVGVRIVVIHGGGPQIARQLSAAGIAERKHKGLRITDEPTMKIVAAALAGVNRDIVAALDRQGAAAVAFADAADSLLQVCKLPAGEVDYGLVGTVSSVSAAPALAALERAVPVLAPLGVDASGTQLNINADEAAAAVAAHVGAKALLLLTDTDGVTDSTGKIASELTASQLGALIEDGTVSAGMVPKVGFALDALAKGVGSCRIINGTAAHPLLLDLLTDEGVGTMLVP